MFVLNILREDKTLRTEKNLPQYVLKTKILKLRMTYNRSKHVVLYNKWFLVVFGQILS
jgi:hypothetical protein